MDPEDGAVDMVVDDVTPTDDAVPEPTTDVPEKEPSTEPELPEAPADHVADDKTVEIIGDTDAPPMSVDHTYEDPTLGSIANIKKRRRDDYEPVDTVEPRKIEDYASSSSAKRRHDTAPVHVDPMDFIDEIDAAPEPVIPKYHDEPIHVNDPAVEALTDERRHATDMGRLMARLRQLTHRGYKCEKRFHYKSNKQELMTEVAIAEASVTRSAKIMTGQTYLMMFVRSEEAAAWWYRQKKASGGLKYIPFDGLMLDGLDNFIFSNISEFDDSLEILYDDYVAPVIESHPIVKVVFTLASMTYQFHQQNTRLLQDAESRLTAQLMNNPQFLDKVADRYMSQQARHRPSFNDEREDSIPTMQPPAPAPTPESKKRSWHKTVSDDEKHLRKKYDHSNDDDTGDHTPLKIRL